MIDEDQPQRQPAKQIEPQFALAGRRQRDRRRGRRHPGRLVLRGRGLSASGPGNLIGNRRHQAPFWAGGLSRLPDWKDNIGPQLANKIRRIMARGRALGRNYVETAMEYDSAAPGLAGNWFPPIFRYDGAQD